MPTPSILRIERLNYILGGIIVIVAALTQPRAIALGVTVGVALTCANFFVLRRLVNKWTSDAAQGKSGNAPLLMLPKMVGLMGAVAVAILVLPINPIAFVIGYSLFFVSIILETTYSALKSGAEPTAPNGNDNHHG